MNEIALRLGDIPLVIRSHIVFNYNNGKLPLLMHRFIVKNGISSPHYTLEIVYLPLMEKTKLGSRAIQMELPSVISDYLRCSLKKFPAPSDLERAITTARDCLLRCRGNEKFHAIMGSFHECSGEDFIIYVRDNQNDPWTKGLVVFIDKRQRLATAFIPEEIYPFIYDAIDQAICFTYSMIVPKGVVLHASAVVKDEACYMFLGPSGAGKSTVVNLSECDKVLTDDVLIVRQMQEYFWAYPTYWLQVSVPSERLANDGSYRLKSIFFLKQDKQTYLRQLSAAECLAKTLLHSIHFLKFVDQEQVKQTFRLCSDMYHSISCYEMHFEKNNSFWFLINELR